jgi:NADH-quinone oxidoreductase subunit K
MNKIFNYFIINFFLFCLGLFGIILNRQNIIIILMSIELLLLSINLNFLYFSFFIDDVLGQVFSLIILTVAAAESAIGLAIIILFFKISGNISIYKINLLSL